MIYVSGNSGMALVYAHRREWAYRVVNSAARSLRRDLKKQGKFGVDAGAPRTGPPKITRRLFQTEFTTHSPSCRHPHVNTALHVSPQKP